MLPTPLRGEVERRAYEVPQALLSSFPLRELARLIAQRLDWFSLTRHETGWACIDAVYRSLDVTVARLLPKWKRRAGLTCVHTYEDGAWATLRAAREEGITASYDLPIAYWETSRRLLEAEAARLPEWEQTLVGTRDSEAKLQRKTEELKAADLVICPSNFVLYSIPESLRAGRRCVVARFGSPPVDVSETRRARKPGDALRVLFAGSMSQRKGLADLFEAVRMLNRKDVELVVMGSPVADLSFYQRQCTSFRYEPPRPHEAVLDLMKTCDILCLPSIVEGRALVQQEAMSCGLPLIVTPNAGAEDMIDEGKTGFLVPPGNPAEICRRVDWCADHRSELEEMGRAARAKASELTWAGYAQTVIAHFHA
jgi:glycosyltransferase involved in cell wall biosynthesis